MINYEILDKYRVKDGPYASKPGKDFGFFFIPYQNYTLKVLCAPMSETWQHVSVSLKNRCPNWPEMSYIKGLFWGEDETVLQFHPKKDAYVNYHPHCLHLWKRRDEDFELPPMILVGPKIIYD